MLLLFGRTSGVGIAANPATATASASVATFTTVRQAVFAAETATVDAEAEAGALVLDRTWPAETAEADAQAHDAALHQVIPVGEPTLVGAGTASFTATNAANLTPGLPAGWLPDDIHILLAHRSDNTAMTALAGWTQIAALSGNNTIAQRVEVWVRRAVAGDSDPVTVTFGSGTVVRGARIYGVRGCPTTGLATDQIDASARSSNATADLTIEFPAVTTTGTDRLMLLLAAFEDDPNAATTPTGFTVPAGNNAGSTLGNDMSLWHWTRDVSTAQTVTPSVSTVSGGGVGVSPSVGISLTFEPLTVPAGSITMTAATATGSSAAIPTVFESDTGTVQMVAQTAQATAASQMADYHTGALTTMSVATAAASGLASTFVGGLTVAAPTATSTTQAIAPSLQTGARFPASTATSVSGAINAAMGVIAIFGALTANSPAIARIATYVTQSRISALTATVTTLARVAAILAVSLFPATTATAQAATEAATITTGGQITAPRALVTATAPVCALRGGSVFPAARAFATVFIDPVEFIMAAVGAIVIDGPTLTGQGSVPILGTGAITIPRPAINAVGFSAQIIGTSNIVIAAPGIATAATYTYTSNADIILPPPILNGLGATPVDGLGGVDIGRPSLTGAGAVQVTGIGAIIIAGPSVHGEGTLIWSGASVIVMPRPALFGRAPVPPPGPPPPLVPTDVHIIEAFDINGVLLGRIQPIKRAKFTMVENDVGDFEIEVPWIYDDIINIMQTRNRIEYTLRGVKVFGGFIQKRQFRQESRYSLVTLSGAGYNGVLTSRIIVPPATFADDVYVNVRADDLMKNIVRNHLGANAPVARRVQGFTVQANTGQSSFLTNYNGRYETVMDALKSITEQCTDTKFLVVRSPSGGLEFRTYVPIIGAEHGIGQPNTVLFDMAGGNAFEVEYVEDGTAVRNYIIGGGTGDDADRMIREGFNAESMNDWGRIEEFLDTNAATTPELDLEILRTLDEKSRAGPSLSFTIGQAGRYTYPTDFVFGDRVSAIWKEAGLTLTDVISGITINLEENGTLGLDMSLGAPNLFRLAPGRALARFIKGLRGEVGVMQRH